MRPFECSQAHYHETSGRANLKRGDMKLKRARSGSILVLVIVSLLVLAFLGLGLMKVAAGVRHQAIQTKNEATAMLAAEAGYEQAVFKMSQQPDMLQALDDPTFESSGVIEFDDVKCSYDIEFHTFMDSKPVYRIISVGQSGEFSKTVDVYVVQAVSGWDMGMCRVPSSSSGTYKVSYADGEIIDIPIHINNLNDSPDERDIYISGSPDFLDVVDMGEGRKTSGGSDKYDAVMDLFDDAGINFDQPDSKITNGSAVLQKIQRFKDSTKANFSFTPNGQAGVSNSQDAVQLEFFVEGSIGKVRVTNNCTVRGFKQSSDSRTWDYRIKPGTSDQYERYYIYSYHVMPDDAVSTGERKTYNIEDSYVTQSYGGVESEAGGQIFVQGNVIIGGDKTSHSGNQLLNGKLTVVATGNIWIADSLLVDGAKEGNGMPSQDNPNILGLIAQGVVRVVDPGMSKYAGWESIPSGYDYVPVGVKDTGSGVEEHDRHLSESTIIEAALTIGGGGFGAENVRRSSYGGRKESGSNPQDKLVLRGTISEALRGVVGLIGSDGYLKRYYMDRRLLEGILPGDFWLKGKYIPAPAGWHDYRK